MKTRRPTNRTPRRRNHGMNWIAPTSRLAIYLRDGLACAYCGVTAEQCERLTLDHLKPYGKGGTNAATNLVTCCISCNSSRGTRSVAAFARAVSAYRGRPTAAEIVAHVRNCAKRTLPRAEARALIARRGTCRAALASL